MKRNVWLSLIIMIILAGCATKNAQNKPNNPVQNNVGKQTSNTIINIKYLKMINSQVGWAVGNNFVGYTTDGGNRWRSVTPFKINAAEQLVSWYFLNAQSAWIAADDNQISKVVVYHTANKGEAWHETTINSYSMGPSWMNFINGQQGWIMLDLGAAAGSMGVELWRTTNGGQTWARLVHVAFNVNDGSGLPLGGDKTGISFLNASTGWITGSEPGGIAPILYKSNNSGIDWHLQNISLPHLWSSGNRGPTSISILPPKFFGKGHGIFPAEFTKFITVAGGIPKTIVATDFYNTTNGGITWHGTEVLQSQNNRPYVGYFLNSRLGWASAGRDIRITRDGGMHWGDIKPNMRLTNIRELDFTDEKMGFAVVGSGRLLKSVDGGSRWIIVRPRMTRNNE